MSAQSASDAHWPSPGGAILVAGSRGKLDPHSSTLGRWMGPLPHCS
jgi:hypothetical protein